MTSLYIRPDGTFANFFCLVVGNIIKIKNTGNCIVLFFCRPSGLHMINTRIISSGLGKCPVPERLNNFVWVTPPAFQQIFSSVWPEN